MTCERVHHSDPESVYAGRATGMNFAKAVRFGHVGEPGWLGNQYALGDYDRDESVDLFERDLWWAIEGDARVKWALYSLYGKKLGCYCGAGERCHADVIAAAVNKLYLENQ